MPTPLRYGMLREEPVLLFSGLIGEKEKTNGVQHNAVLPDTATDAPKTLRRTPHCYTCNVREPKVVQGLPESTRKRGLYGPA